MILNIKEMLIRFKRINKQNAVLQGNFAEYFDFLAKKTVSRMCFFEI